MSEQEKANETERQFAIQRVYVKDLSFEVPGAPQIFTQSWKPDISVNLGSSVQELGNDVYELVLTVTVTAKVEDKTAFVAEVQQAGIFLIKGVAEDEMGPMIGVYCPNLLFPFAREAISDLVTRGSFPQFLLAPVNFEAMYLQQLQQQQAEAAH